MIICWGFVFFVGVGFCLDIIAKFRLWFYYDLETGFASTFIKNYLLCLLSVALPKER